MTEKNDKKLLLIKAAVYADFRSLCVSFKPEKLNNFKIQLQKCAQLGLIFEHLNKWTRSQEDIVNFRILDVILQSDIRTKEKNSEKYQAFFVNAGELFQELKPYSDAYYEVKTRNLKLNKLGFYFTTGNQVAPKTAATQNRAKSKPKTSTAQNLKNTVIKFNDLNNFTDFSKDSTELNIYIDEAWPCNDEFSDDPENKKIGVIAGIVWLGNEINPKVLPHIPTHLRQRTKKLEYKMLSEAEKIRTFLLPPIQNLFNCENAMPFIFPLKMEDKINSAKDYFTIFEAAIKILLGWVLPQKGKKCNVRIYPEHFSDDFSAIGNKTNKTEYFCGVLNQAMKDTGRFERFNLEKVEWQEKDFGYIPYGDLLGYMTLSNPKSLEFRELSKCEELDGYLPISIGLFELLSRLDIIEETKNVEDIYNLIDRIYGTKIYKFIMSDLKNRLENNVELKTKILESIEAKYLAKDRDLRKLRWYFREIMPFIESEEESANTVTKLLFTSIRLQNANHDGNPAKIEKYLADYDEKRAKAIEVLREFEMAADCELHLAVHYNDMFQFDKALEVLERNEKYFDSLKLPTLGKFYSSLGQNKSINRNFDEAKVWFDKALEEFNKSEDRGKALEIEQTSVYRLFNALEGNDPEYLKMFTGFFGSSPEIAAKFAKENSVADQYKHHLLVRSLFSRNDLGEFKAAYLAEKESWDFLPQHPWQLIEFYRAMLESDTESFYGHMENALAICENEEHGGIIYLIGAVIAAAGATKFSEDQKEFLQKKALEFVEKAENMRVIGKETAMLREKIKENCGIENILEILPFNYR